VQVTRQPLAEFRYEEAVHIAERFKRAMEQYDWAREDPRLADRPVPPFATGPSRRHTTPTSTGIRAGWLRS